MGGSPVDEGEAKEGFGERAVTYVKQRKGWRMSCDVDKATEGLEN